MRLKLTRPLAFIDIESTGTSTQTDRIVELCIVLVRTNGKAAEPVVFRINPGMSIPPAATAVHGIKDEDVAGKPLFAGYANAILELIDGCDMATFNGNMFDVPMLYNEFMRAGIEWDYSKIHFLDAGVIYKRKESRTLAAAMQFYCNRELKDAHTAEADTLATVDVLLAQVDRYTDMPTTVAELALYCNYDKQMLDLSGKFTYNAEGLIVLNFGQHRGQPAKDHLDFLTWMLYKANFPPDTRAICQRIMEEAKPKQDHLTTPENSLPFA